MNEISVFEGKNLKITVAGGSHTEKISLYMEGFPAGVRYDGEFVMRQMQRRAPGGAYASARREPDCPILLSGFPEGVSDGTPIAMEIVNKDARPGDYQNERFPRPGHADYPALVKYAGDADLRGGGHFSGRMTAPLVFAGALCMLAQRQKGITYTGHLLQIGEVSDRRFLSDDLTPEKGRALSDSDFPVLDPQAGEAMKNELENCIAKGDSVGGSVECAVLGLPVGIGSHMARSVEATLSGYLFAIPAVKGVEFGEGFGFAALHGSEANDGYEVGENGGIVLCSNHCGGVLGGMTCGTPLIFRAVFKPTPSISLPQKSVDLKTNENATLRVTGRHDPCVAKRGIVAIEAAAAIALEELILDGDFPA